MLANIIAKEAENVFQEIFEKYPKNNFYGFAIYTDESATAIDIAANSLEYLSQTVSEVRNKRRQVIASFECKWYSIEWELEGGFASSFKETKSTIDSLFIENSESVAVSIVIQAMSDALNILDKKNIFSKRVQREDVVLCISAPDAERNEEIYEHSIHELNPTVVVQKFLSERDKAYGI